MLVAAGLFASAAASATLGAQASTIPTIAGVSRGSRVRVATRDAEPFVATLARDAGDTLVVELPSGASLALPQARITRLEVSGGVQRRTWQGAGVGLLAGAGVGAIVGLATYHRSDCGDSQVGQAIVCPLIDGVSREVTVYADALLIGAAGSVIGALVGHAGHEKWIPVSLPRVGEVHARLGVRRVAKSIGVGAALEF